MNKNLYVSVDHQFADLIFHNNGKPLAVSFLY